MKKYLLFVLAFLPMLSIAQSMAPITILDFENKTPNDCIFLTNPELAFDNKIEYDIDIATTQMKPIAYTKKVCVFITTIKAPDGYKVKMKKIEFGGKIDLIANTRGKVTASYLVPSNAAVVAGTVWMATSRQFAAASKLDSNAEWSACGDTLTVQARTEASLLSMSGAGFGNLAIQSGAGGFFRFEYSVVPC